MKKNKKILIIVSILIALLTICIVFCIINFKNENYNNETINNVYDENEDYSNEIINNAYIELDKNEIQYQENVTVEDLKEQTSITGNTEIYEVEQEYDGRKVLIVKADVKYKVAFAGMIKKTTPKYEELDTILEQNLPKYSGVWVEKNSRDKILKLFNNSENTNSQYYIDDNGYLKISKKNSQTASDKKIENAIIGDKQFIVDVSSVCYIIDDITGEILDYNFENMDRYQIYEYFEDADKSIIFVNQNSYGQLSDLEIFNSIVQIF